MIMQLSQSDSTAYKNEGAFLRSLIAYLNSAECPRLCDSLEKVEKEERCIRHAQLLMLMLFMLVAGSLGYCALLLPHVFRDLTDFLVRGLFVLGLAALISQLVFLGYMLWHRSLVARLHEECRLLVLAMVCSQLERLSCPNSADAVAAQSSGTSRMVYPAKTIETTSAN